MKTVNFAGKNYLSVTGFENRATRRAASRNARSNAEGRRAAHRMNRPGRLNEVDSGHQKLCAFFKIAP